MARVLRRPVVAARDDGAAVAERVRGVPAITGRIGRFALDQTRRPRDPVARLRRQLARYGTRLDLLEREIDAEIAAVVARVAEPEHAAPFEG
jgi:hypothetical protein